MSSPLQVLIVDDSLSMRVIAKTFVTALGHEVVGEAADGKEAIKQYFQLKPDLVMLDLVMPRFDGKKTLKKLRELDPEANIVICSSLGSEGDIEFCLNAGAKFYLQKPFELAGVENALAQITRPLESQT